MSDLHIALVSSVVTWSMSNFDFLTQSFTHLMLYMQIKQILHGLLANY